MLADAFAAAKSRVDDSCPQGSAASVAMLYFHRHGCLAANVGDCCIYHIRPKTHSLLYRSVGNEGTIAANAPKSVAPTVVHITNVRYGDYFLLLSQGAADVISDKRLMEMVCAKATDENKIDQLKVTLDSCGDNHSAHLIRVSGVMQEALDERLHDDEQQVMQSYIQQQDKTASVTPVVQPSNTTQPSHTAQSSKTTQSPQTVRPTPQTTVKAADTPAAPSQQEREKKGGALVTILAALATLAILAGVLFFFGRQKKEPQPEIAKEVVQKDTTVKKDTVNVMEMERNKLKKDTAKVEKPEKSANKAPESDSIKLEERTLDIPAVLDNTQPSVEQSEPATRQRQETTTEPAANAPATTPTTSPTTTTPANPNQVTPRPVIPEDE